MSDKGDQIVTRKDGTRVILKPDGTWALMKSSDSPQRTTGPHFRKASWGMRREEIIALESGKPNHETSDFLIYTAEVAGLSCDIIYIIAQGQLVRAKYSITEKHSNENIYLTDYESLKDMVARKYGKPSEDETLLCLAKYRRCAGPSVRKTVASPVLAARRWQSI